MTLPEWIADRPGAAILCARGLSWSLSDLAERSSAFIALLDAAKARGRAVGLLADNCADWIATDLAVHAHGSTLVPLAGFFTADQMQHAVESTAMHALICDNHAQALQLGFGSMLGRVGAFSLYLRSGAEASDATDSGCKSVQKITFTSGTTGAPKGVQLTAGQQLRTARALADALAPLKITRHLNLLPFPVLLENVAGIYTPLMLGATCCCVGLSEVGLSGASAFDAARCLAAIDEHAAESIILLPQMLADLIAHIERYPQTRAQVAVLKFVAVGGARTPIGVLRRARAFGMPVYEGYGLTECASVVSLNLPEADRIGSVGRPLPGTRVRIARDGEIEISGRTHAGYLGADAQAPSWLQTGDLGSIDEAGFVWIAGRKKHVFITSYGRNVSPEWPERILEESPAIGQAVVFGEGRPFPVAVIRAADPAWDDSAIDAAIARANLRLPDYARIGAWVRAAQAFTSTNGLATANGRVRRDAVLRHYQQPLRRLYDKESTAS